jgi:surface antigen
MTRTKGRALAIYITFFAMTGCAAQGEHEEAGMIIGGVLGGMLGAQVDDDHGPRTAAIIIGTMLGSAIGGSVGASMDDTDRLRAGQTLETVRSGVSSTWRNPDTGVNYRFTPNRTYTSSAGPCREYTIDALIGGREEQVYGTACRQADGSWLVTK